MLATNMDDELDRRQVGAAMSGARDQVMFASWVPKLSVSAVTGALHRMSVDHDVREELSGKGIRYCGSADSCCVSREALGRSVNANTAVCAVFGAV